MKEKLKKVIDKIKSFWIGLARKMKILLIAAAGVIVISAVVLTVILNKSDGWITLFPDMSAEESTEVYKELQNMGVDTKINSSSEIQVRESEWDKLVYQLAEKGYPQSAPSYGTFFDNLSMTMSEFEKKQTLRFELQDRIQTTLKRIDGVKGAIVTISLPETTNYVWKENKEKATASVMLTLEKPDQFTGEQVTAVKNIVAYSAQQILPEDVSVVDASTGKELLTSDQDKENAFDNETRINYAQIIKNQYEENAVRILEPIYGKDEVIAVAFAEVDYDKVNKEVKELITNEDGEGVKESQHVEYKTDGVVNADGVTGEENNTDIPNYSNNEDELDSTNTPEYKRDTEWAIGYMLTQTEKAQGGITDASISIVVPTSSGVLTTDEKEMLTQLVKNATNIDETKISVSARLVADPGEEEKEISVSPFGGLLKKKAFKILLIAAGILLLALVVLIIVLINRRAKKKIAMARAESKAQIDNMKKSLEEDQLRKSIEDAARERNNATNATANDVKNFAKNNPEIAAALIRSLMKEQS